MKLARTLSLLGLGLLAASYVAVTQGCSSSSSSGPTTTGPSVGGPPTKPDAPATTSKDEHNYAMYTILLGDTDRAGTPSQTAWKKFGFNIDGKVTDKSSKDVCTPAPGAGTTTQIDGDNGIDNAFGSVIVPIIQTFTHDISKTLTDSIQKGSFTVMLDTIGLSSDPAQTNTGLTGQLFAGSSLSTTPTFTMADKWPVRPELLNDGTTIASGSKVKFTDAFVINGQWVNGTGSDVSLSLSFSGQSLTLTIHKATIVFQHSGSTADNGTIAGVINTDELISSLKAVAGNISSSLCEGSAFDSIAGQIKQASDILTDGTNKAGVPCDAISIGIGFTGKEIAPPSVVGPAAGSGTDKCADAGTTDDGSTGTDSSTGEDSSTTTDSGIVDAADSGG